MKKTHKTTIFRRIFLPLLFVVLAQAGLLYGILKAKNVFAEQRRMELNLLCEQTENKYRELYEKMGSEWSDLGDAEKEIISIIEKVLAEQEIDWESGREDVELNAKIEDAICLPLQETLRDTHTSGVFVILDGKGNNSEENSYASVYIRDADPETRSEDNSDLSLVRGLPALARKMNISLESTWEAVMTLNEGEEDSEFFFKPLQEAKKNGLLVPEYSAYWSRPFSVDKKYGSRIISYSLPLIGTNGEIYGILGVEISEEQLVKGLEDRRKVKTDTAFFYLGTVEDGENDFKVTAVDDAAYGIGDFTAEIRCAEKEECEEITVTGTIRKKELVGVIKPLGLYVNHSAFESTRWVLIGFQEEGSLYQDSEMFRSLVFLVMFLTAIIGFAIALIAGKSIVNPIQRLGNALKKSEEDKELELPATGIEEIDELAEAIAQMSRDTKEAAKQTSELIEKTGLLVGVYEIRNKPARIYCSEGFFRILGVSEEEKKNFTQEKLEKILENARKDLVHEENDIYEITISGKKKYIRFFSQNHEGSMIGAVLDVTAQIREKRRIERERDYDTLTGIKNRRSFEKDMDELFSHGGLKIGALIMFDLDNLKYINDTFGHDSGDLYIRTFAKALKTFLKGNVLAARRSGDEFYVFLYGYDSKEQLWNYVTECFKKFQEQTIMLSDQTRYRLRVSGGLSWYPENSIRANELIYYADFAMYCVKHSQKGTIRQFDAETYKKNAFLFNGHDALDRLIEDQLVSFVYQPIYSAVTGTLFGYEMLMRSQINELKTPSIILEMAKSQGKLSHIERLTWMKGLSDTRKQIEKGIIRKDAYIFINSIANQTLFEDDKELIEEQYADLLPKLVMEVTESESNNMEYTTNKLHFIKSNGGQVAIDDFGTGYNGEMALVTIPSEIVKIDMSLVRDVDSNPDKQVLVKNLIRFAKQREIAVLAEGVETSSEMRTLILYGVQYLQGYYLAKPQNEPQELSEEKAEEIRRDQKEYQEIKGKEE